MSPPSTVFSASLPDEFSWDQSVGLLLDALHVDNLIPQLYEWSDAPEIDVLYQGTQWAQLSEVSPCLLRLRRDDDPILLQFLANSQQQWGYLLVSDGPWEHLLAHMRWLTSIRSEPGDEMFLRISDPAVAHALFAAEQHPDAQLFGPCKQIIVANAPLDGWQLYARSGDVSAPDFNEPYASGPAQWAALKAAAFGKTVAELYRHMQRFFPEYQAHMPAAQRLEHLHALANSAIEQGFAGEQEIFLYANIFGFLGSQALQAQPDILELLTGHSELTSFQRVDCAATLAAQRSV